MYGNVHSSDDSYAITSRPFRLQYAQTAQSHDHIREHILAKNIIYHLDF